MRGGEQKKWNEYKQEFSGLKKRSEGLGDNVVGEINAYLDLKDIGQSRLST